MTIEEFISDHKARKTELKQKDDDLDFANKLIEKLRSENKQMKNNLTGNLDEEIAKEKLKGKYLDDEINKPDGIDKKTDTADLHLDGGDGKRDMGAYEAFEYSGEEDNPEKLKETVAELSRKLREAREELKNRPVNDAYTTQNAQEGDPSTDVVRIPIEREHRTHSNEPPTEDDFRKIDESLKR